MPAKKKTMSALLKRPASAVNEVGEGLVKKPKVDLMKRPAAAQEEANDEKKAKQVLLKRPASAAQEEADDEEEEAQQVQEANPAQEARDAIKVVQQHQRLITKLSSENDRWAEKIKSNKALLRKAEKEMEIAKSEASKKSRKLGAINGAKLRKQMLVKKNRFVGQSDRAAAAVKAATKRYNKLKKLMKNSSSKSGDVEMVFKRAQSSYEDAKKLCAKLKKEGEDVPEEGFKDYAAASAWKPPGYKAAKARDVAKEAFLKAKDKFEKAAAPNKARQERLAALKEKVNEAKANQAKVEEALAELKKGKKK